MTTVAHNPVIRGFDADPSIVAVGEDYYLATSTMEWYPGVRIHHSRDLVHWRVVGHAATEANGLDLRGHPDSGGIWAPSITVADGLFWVAYSVVRTMDGDNKDLDNYLTTAPTPQGPWSTPIRLGSRGFDFSFFHDAGRHWIVGVQWDHRPGRQRFAGIVLEEYLADEQRVSGQAHLIYTQDGLVEGPNLYRFGDEYHLLLAEGGTGWNHGITSARSRSLLGPYERDPHPAILTSRDDPGARLAKAGHGELVELPGGELALVHLASRPALHLGRRYCTLGRETCVQRVERDPDGWLRLAGGGHRAAVDVPIPLPPSPFPALPTRDDFEDGELDRARWSTLRAELREYLDLTARPGWLRLRGGQSTASVFDQAMIAQRVPEHRTRAEALLDADPVSSRQAAGLVAWYNRSAWIWLQVTWDEERGRHLRLVRRDGATTTVESEPMAIPDGPVRARLDLDGPLLRFFVAERGSNQWRPIGAPQPAWTLSDDHGDALRFTGLLVGVRAEDLDGTGWFADIDYIEVAGDGVETSSHSRPPEES